MSGPFIGAHYKEQENSDSDIKLITLAWGFTLGFGFLTCSKALDQTLLVWRKSHSLNTYVVLIWAEVLGSFVYGILVWLLSIGVMKMNIYILVTIVIAWSIELQALLQIIINRVALLIPNKRKVAYIKWGVAVIMTLINLSVFIIWIPARLQISDQWIRINNIWDRIEKILYLLIDGCLNAYFLWLVHSKLVATGMTKYRPLFRFNACIVLISLSMDVLIISMMALSNSWVYTQFHPLAYMVKLNIELTMASLITKIARQSGQSYGSSNGGRVISDAGKGGNAKHISFATRPRAEGFIDPSSDEFRNPRYQAWVDGPQTRSQSKQMIDRDRYAASDSVIELSDSDDSMHQDQGVMVDGIIMKTTETRIIAESIDLGETPSESDSTRDLNVDFNRGQTPQTAESASVKHAQK